MRRHKILKFVIVFFDNVLQCFITESYPDMKFRINLNHNRDSVLVNCTGNGMVTQLCHHTSAHDFSLCWSFFPGVTQPDNLSLIWVDGRPDERFIINL